MDRLAVSCRTLDPSQLDEFLAFADSEAFADNDEWSGCYCVFSYLATSEHGPFDPRAATENREIFTRLLVSSEGHWVVAYLENQIVGWVNADLLTRLRRYDDWGALEPGETGVIACFVVHPLLRRRGVARQLLAAACESLRDMGARRVEAWVVTDPAAGATPPFSFDQVAHRGPLPMYLAEGFTVVERDDDSTRVRLEFQP